LGVRDGLDDISHTVQNWVAACSPPAASPEQIFVVEAYLVLFFHLDDYTGSDFPELCDSYRATLSKVPLSLSSPVASFALSDLLRQIRKLSSDGNYSLFVTQFQRLLEAYKWRHRIQRREHVTTIEEYCSNRYFTINVLPYLALWQTITDHLFTGVEIHSEIINECNDSTIKFMYLSNDVSSIQRDTSSNTPNYVLIYADEHHTTLPAAIAATKAQRDNELERFRACQTRASAQNLTANQAWYISFISDMFDSYYQIMRKDAFRYDNPQH
jgi:hypothetical protein